MACVGVPVDGGLPFPAVRVRGAGAGVFRLNLFSLRMDIELLKRAPLLKIGLRHDVVAEEAEEPQAYTAGTTPTCAGEQLRPWVVDSSFVSRRFSRCGSSEFLLDRKLWCRRERGAVQDRESLLLLWSCGCCCWF